MAIKQANTYTEPEQKSYNCKANGCICFGGGSDGLCIYHMGVEAKDWPHATQKIKDNESLLKAIKWVNEEGRYLAHEDGRKTLSRLNDRYPTLAPDEDETPMTWTYRAIAYIRRQVGAKP